MLWTTRSQLHLDRAACVWLVRRFIDSDAEFAFIGWEDEPGRDAMERSFGIPGFGVGAHDDAGTAFRKLLRRHGLESDVLLQMERIVASGVADALGHDPPAEQSEHERLIGIALNRLGSALAVAYDDPDHASLACGLYEGLFAMCEIATLSDQQRAGAPRRPSERVAYLRALTARS